MVLVRELITNSSFNKAVGFDSFKPKISILLPTFSRGDNGLFCECVDSLLNQTFKEFELIIIDDASIDSTSNHIQRFIQKDSRIACIRYSENVGLPAVSEADGYLRSRASKIFFAFDDNIYHPEILATSYESHIKNNINISYTAAEIMYKENKANVLGDIDFDINTISYKNYIPNSTILVDKTVIEDVGLYDPHISMSRICDWDLWNRIGKKYPLYRIPGNFTTEKGPLLADSIGNSYPLNFMLITEWMAIDRNKILAPDNILDYDVAIIPNNISDMSKFYLLDIIKYKFNKYLSRDSFLSLENKNSQYTLIVTDGYNSQLELISNKFSAVLKHRFIVITNYEYYEEFSKELLLNAQGIIFYRILNKNLLSFILRLCNAKIPVYYIIDNGFLDYKSDLKLGQIKKLFRKITGTFIYEKEADSLTHPLLFKIIPSNLASTFKFNQESVKRELLDNQMLVNVQVCYNRNLLYQDKKRYNLKYLVKIFCKTVLYYKDKYIVK